MIPSLGHRVRPDGIVGKLRAEVDFSTRLVNGRLGPVGQLFDVTL